MPACSACGTRPSWLASGKRRSYRRSASPLLSVNTARSYQPRRLARSAARRWVAASVPCSARFHSRRASRGRSTANNSNARCRAGQQLLLALRIVGQAQRADGVVLMQAVGGEEAEVGGLSGQRGVLPLRGCGVAGGGERTGAEVLPFVALLQRRRHR